MNHRKKYVIRWTPRLVKTILALVLIAIVVGGIIGFGIGRGSAMNNETPNESSTQEYQSQFVVSTETEKVYYDCPLDYSLQDYIRQLCEKNGVSMPLVIAMVEVESSFKANAISNTNDYGLMQINKINHQWLSEEYGITNFLDPYQNVLCGITMISQHYNRFQDVDKALMAYNLGVAGAKKLWDNGVYDTTYTRKIRTAIERYENEI